MKKWREIVVMALFGYLGLGFPDVDRLLLGILHHRSIITHSLFIPALLMMSKNASMKFAGAGFLLGVSIHLSADLLSSTIGFAMVWLPWPIKIPLGIGSPLWLFLNALIGLVWARVVIRKLGGGASEIIYLILAVVFSASYSVFHEQALMPFVSFFVVFSVSLFASQWITKQNWFRRFPT